MEAINSFSGGMNSDISKQLHSKDSYLQALNFRSLTEIGGSNGSLVNIKGNECKLTFPDLQPVYKLEVVAGTLTTSNNLALTINGVTYNTSITNSTTGANLYNFIIANFENCYSYTGTTVATKTFDVAYDDNFIVIYNQPVYQDCTTIASVPPVISTVFGTTDGSQALLYFINQNFANSLTQDTSHPYVAGVPSALIIPIGSTFILNDIYILTATNNPSYGPADITNEIPANDELQFGGAIWKLNIDDISKQHTLTLLYSNNIDFTKYHPIPPSAITGRYESMDIKRIYWSDNYNKIRTINTAQPQLMALNPSQLSVIPKIEFVQPILNSIGSGSLNAGCYQMAYRLSKVLGSITNYSELSLPVYLTANAESTAFENYEGALGASGKSITWYISNLDTTYDQIEPIVTYRSSASAVAFITSMGVQPITEVMNITYSDASTSGYTEVTLEEFLLFNGTFTHAKTVDTKDNRLFWGNVRAPRKELEAFDSRCFRANDVGNILLKNNGASSTYNPTTAAALDQTEDCINEYYDNSGNYSSNACYLKPSTATSTKILGGEGPNISYEFGTWSISSDVRFSIASTSNYDIGTLPPSASFRQNNVDTGTITLTDYVYPQNSKYYSLKQPEKTSLLKGFQHEEIYRFGIQFFDKQGNPYFTKWIGDIKMPSYGDFNNNPDATAAGQGVNDFRLSYYKPYPQDADQFTQILYIKFTVDITSIQNVIGGYQIVRVKREGNNKTIWGVGMINPFESNDRSNTTSAILPASWDTRVTTFNNPGTPPTPTKRYYNPYPDQWHIETLNSDFDDGSSPIGQFKMFDCWDMDAGLRPSYSAGDKILVRSRLKCANYNGTSGSNSYRAYFGTKGIDISGANVPPDNARINDHTYGGPAGGPFTTASNNDSGSLEPFFIMKMVDESLYADYQDFLSTNSNDFTIVKANYMSGNTSQSASGGYTIKNYGVDVYSSTIPLFPATGNPSLGKQTLFLELNNKLPTATTYGCVPNDTSFKKLLALYYKPNNTLYGGATYSSRANNEYIPSGEFISTSLDNTNRNQNITFINFGGDVFTTIYDMMKTVKAAGSDYTVYQYNSSHVFTGLGNRQAKFSTSFFFPSTVSYNSEVRLGNHPNRALNNDGGYGEDDYSYESYNNAENDIKTYFPKPLNFQSADEWINRIYFSEIKFNNEPIDSWSQYLTNSFYDVEGNYGPINALVSLKENMYYIQERGLGLLMINPVSMVNDQLGQPIKLGASNDVIQKHYYKAIDVGTSHQWSVYRSQSTITFVDARHKKIYLFNGESVSPISDVKGQRNFVIKRLHNELLKFDNPVIDKGILVTYDYYHNEFLYTFNNVKVLTSDPVTYDTVNDENLTLSYSEIADNFTGMYTFAPNLYINSNKYLISTNRDNKLWFHNYGDYGTFYGIVFPSLLKLIINDGPLYTKVFDNYAWNSESVKDNVEWNDDFNLYPGSPTTPSYPDDVNNQLDTFTRIRCYNDWQNTDWVTLTSTPPNNNLTRKERNFNLQVPRNKFNYDTSLPSVNSLFNPSNLTKTTFGERIRDKYVIIDLYYPNTINNRFIIHNLKSTYRVSDR